MQISSSASIFCQFSFSPPIPNGQQAASDLIHDSREIPGIGVVGDYCAVDDFFKHRKVVEHFLLGFIRLALPDQAILLLGMEQFEECTFILFAQTAEFLYFPIQLCLIHD